MLGKKLAESSENWRNSRSATFTKSTAGLLPSFEKGRSSHDSVIIEQSGDGPKPPSGPPTPLLSSRTERPIPPPRPEKESEEEQKQEEQQPGSAATEISLEESVLMEVPEFGEVAPEDEEEGSEDNLADDELMGALRKRFLFEKSEGLVQDALQTRGEIINHWRQARTEGRNSPRAPSYPAPAAPLRMGGRGRGTGRGKLIWSVPKRSLFAEDNLEQSLMLDDGNRLMESMDLVFEEEEIIMWGEEMELDMELEITRSSGKILL
jgi:hypothetical protein